MVAERALIAGVEIDRTVEAAAGCETAAYPYFEQSGGRHRTRIAISGRFILCIALGIPGWVADSGARVDSLDVHSREPVLAGRDFGAAGAYEKLSGEVIFAFDPANPVNQIITDLDAAPRNSAGQVEARANWMMLRPVAAPADGALLVEISNRGSKAALGYFNAATFSDDPVDDQDFGDGFLMRHGFTVLWVGWQFDVPPAGYRLRLQVPRATAGAETISGLVRADWVVDAAATRLQLGHRGQIPYQPSDPADIRNQLSERDSRDGIRRVLPRDDWHFDAGYISHRDQFRAGKIYELVYVSSDPAIVGLGLAAVRDFASHLKFEHPETAGAPILGFGVSQTGRFLRHFLYQGFNIDERGRVVFDGLLIHSAGGGRGSFNHRFAQPSRDGHAYSSFFYPTDLFPFSGRVQLDTTAGQRLGLLSDDIRYRPRVMYSNTGYEYWGRAASLLHTDPGGQRDVQLLPEERLYHLASTQHFPLQLSALRRINKSGVEHYRGNPIDFMVNLRALLLGLRGWVRGAEPPPSRYPHIDQRTLVTVGDYRFPRLPGLEAPRSPHHARRLDFGPRWPQGIIDKQPPDRGAAFPALVAQVDGMGNELGGVRDVELLAPLGTYMPWLLRHGEMGGNGELTNFYGGFAPLPRDEEERGRRGDPRPAVSMLYEDRRAYLDAVEAALEQLISEQYLLDEDRTRVTDHAAALWDWLMALPAATTP
jgi:hypothetical protein